MKFPVGFLLSITFAFAHPFQLDCVGRRLFPLLTSDSSSLAKRGVSTNTSSSFEGDLVLNIPLLLLPHLAEQPARPGQETDATHSSLPGQGTDPIYGSPSIHSHLQVHINIIGVSDK